MPAAFRTLCLERRSDSRLTAAERQAEVERVGQDSRWLLDRLASTAGAALQVAAAVRTLATIWQQRYERVDGQVRWRDKTVDSTELIVTPHDPGVRAGQKRGRTWRGDKAPITETIAEPPTAADAGSAEPADPVRFITDVTTSPAPSGDGQALAEIREHRTERDLLPTEQVVDSGYVSGKHLAESEAAGIDLIGPPLADTATNGFKLDDFTIDRDARRAVCPARQVATKWAIRTERDGSQSVQIRFPTAVCAAGPLRPQCTTGASGHNLTLAAMPGVTSSTSSRPPPATSSASPGPSSSANTPPSPPSWPDPDRPRPHPPHSSRSDTPRSRPISRHLRQGRASRSGHPS